MPLQYFLGGKLWHLSAATERVISVAVEAFGVAGASVVCCSWSCCCCELVLLRSIGIVSVALGMLFMSGVLVAFFLGFISLSEECGVQREVVIFVIFIFVLVILRVIRWKLSFGAVIGGRGGSSCS